MCCLCVQIDYKKYNHRFSVSIVNSIVFAFIQFNNIKTYFNIRHLMGKSCIYKLHK